MRTAVRGAEIEGEAEVRFVSRILDIDFACEKGYTVPLSEVSALEFSAHRILCEERIRYQDEQSKMPQKKWQKV